MSAPTKRRHVSYYLSFPLVVAIVFLVVAQLAAWQRAEMVADLADRVSHEDAVEATAALRKLAAMPRPPLEVLVGAANSADQTVADEAQHLISGLLRRWQREIESQRREDTVACQLRELADALAQQQTEFSTADHAWVRKTARKIMRLANRMPAQKSPLVAAQCDTVFAALAASETSAAAFVDRQVAVASRPEPPLPTDKPTEAARSEMEREYASYAVRPMASATASVVVSESAAENEKPIKPTTPSEQPSVPEEESQSSRVLKWLHPMLGAAPAMPINAAPTDVGSRRGKAELPEPKRPGGSAAPSPSEGLLDPNQAREVERPEDSKGPSRSEDLLDPNHPATEELPLADTDARELLARWLEADGRKVFPLEEELTRRGFGRLSARLVEPLFAEDAADRLRLVDDVLTEPGVDARPWLLLLADDADADVRLLAVTIMATSDDRGLIEKAWQVAIRDHDPRIAGLAGRLRERRGNVQRR